MQLNILQDRVQSGPGSNSLCSTHRVSDLLRPALLRASTSVGPRTLAGGDVPLPARHVCPLKRVKNVLHVLLEHNLQV